MEVTYCIIVTGKVQGVFYRQSTKEKAREIGVKGIVMNQDDGSVKIIVTGTPQQVEQLIQWCHEGPPKARVDKVTSTEEAHQDFINFSIERS